MGVDGSLAAVQTVGCSAAPAAGTGLRRPPGGAGSGPEAPAPCRHAAKAQPALNPKPAPSPPPHTHPPTQPAVQATRSRGGGAYPRQLDLKLEMRARRPPLLLRILHPPAPGSGMPARRPPPCCCVLCTHLDLLCVPDVAADHGAAAGPKHQLGAHGVDLRGWAVGRFAVGQSAARRLGGWGWAGRAAAHDDDRVLVFGPHKPQASAWPCSTCCLPGPPWPLLRKATQACRSSCGSSSTLRPGLAVTQAGGGGHRRAAAPGCACRLRPLPTHRLLGQGVQAGGQRARGGGGVRRRVRA